LRKRNEYSKERNRAVRDAIKGITGLNSRYFRRGREEDGISSPKKKRAAKRYPLLSSA
jgi:hypothetical protein